MPFKTSELITHGEQQRSYRVANFTQFSLIVLLVSDYPVDTFVVGVKAVKAQFKACYQVNDHAGTDAIGEAENVDGGRYLLPDDVSPGIFEMVFEHIDIAFDNRSPYRLLKKNAKVTFLHDHCIETEHHGLSEALTEGWLSRLYKPGTLLGPSK